MEESGTRQAEYREAIRRRIPVATIVTVGLVALAAALTFGLPAIYKSRAIILVEQQEIPQDLVRSLITGYVDQRIQVISQRVLTTANLTAIINKYDLYLEARQTDPLEAVLVEMRDDIEVTPISADVVDQQSGRSTQATIAFELSYSSKSPALAQRVANELVTLFLNENLKQRTETTEEALRFLARESERLRDEVSDLEVRLAEFKDGNLGKLPELTNLNLQLMNSREQELTQVDSQIRALEQQRVYLESELVQQEPYSKLFTETGERILSPADRLKVLESEFIPMTARYGDDHPDVVAARKQMESLRAEVGGTATKSELMLRLKEAQTELAANSERYSDSHPDVIRLKREIESLEEEISQAPTEVAIASEAPPENPAYIQLEARLEATDTQLASLRQRRATVQAKIAEYEARLTSSPQVEREYRALTRDYETALAQYKEVLAKQQQAEIAKSLEINQKSEKFTLIEPPLTPEEPDSPNRVAIGALGAVFSVVGGVGAGALAETLDSRLYGRAGVLRVLGVPPLAVIPKLETAESRRRRMLGILAIVAGIVLVLAAIAVAVHLTYRPLDVLYFRTLRTLGL